MKPIDREEILPLAEYERIREPFRSRIIAEKKRRRIQIGPKATAVFENRETVLLQIQEMLRTERITRPQAVQHEIDTYNESVPGEDELSMTLMIEIVDKEEREAFLRDAVGFEGHVWLVVGGERERPGARRRLRNPDPPGRERHERHPARTVARIPVCDRQLDQHRAEPAPP